MCKVKPIFNLGNAGDSGVGKSALIYRYTEDTFNCAYITTIGVGTALTSRFIL